MAETFVSQNGYNFCGKCNDERDLTMMIRSDSGFLVDSIECLDCILQKFSDSLDEFRDNEEIMESIKPELSRTKKTAMKLFKLDDPDVLKKKIEELEHKIEVLQELLDRPDNAGAKFGYEQCAKLLQ